MSQLLCLLIGSAFTWFITWCICRQGKGEMPPAEGPDETRYNDDGRPITSMEKADIEGALKCARDMMVHDLVITPDGDIVATNSRKERMV